MKIIKNKENKSVKNTLNNIEIQSSSLMNISVKYKAYFEQNNKQNNPNRTI